MKNIYWASIRTLNAGTWTPSICIAVRNTTYLWKWTAIQKGIPTGFISKCQTLELALGTGSTSWTTPGVSKNSTRKAWIFLRELRKFKVNLPSSHWTIKMILGVMRSKMNGVMVPVQAFYSKHLKSQDLFTKVLSVRIKKIIRSKH